MERMSPIPEVIVDALLARFTESARGTSKYVLVRLKWLSLICEKSTGDLADGDDVVDSYARPVSKNR